MALAPLSQFKLLLGVTSSGTDAQLEAFLESASAAAEAYCMRTFTSTSYVEYYSGTGTSRLALRQRPVTAVSEVRQDSTGAFGKRSGSFGSTTVLTEGTDWVLDYDQDQTSSSSGILLRLDSVWPMVHRVHVPYRVTVDQAPAYGNIKVSYTAGYTVIPQDLQYAVCLLAAYMRRTFTLGGYQLLSEKIGDYSYTLGVLYKKLPELGTVNSILARYKEMGW